MKAYSVFSQYYDALTSNVQYSKRADYLMELMGRLGHKPGLALDLACGTGTLTLELFRRGLDIYGVDASVEMLSCACEKCADAGADILFLCQKMQELDLYGTVDTVFCTLDSLNHLRGKEEVRKAISKVSFFMDPGGWFFFDMNTPYKHEKVLGNNTFVYDMEQVFCVWQNRFSAEACKVDIELDFFEKDGRLYRRSSEHFAEYAYPCGEVLDFLKEAGFEEVHVFHELSFEPPKPDSQRLVYAARKGGSLQNQGNGYGIAPSK